MKTKYKHVYFLQAGKDQWWCRNNKTTSILYKINWYSPWRCYCSEPFTLDVIFSADCHRDIADFLEQLNKERQR